MHDLISCHGNCIVKEYLTLFQKENYKKANIDVILASDIVYHFRIDISKESLCPDVNVS